MDQNKIGKIVNEPYDSDNDWTLDEEEAPFDPNAGLQKKKKKEEKKERTVNCMPGQSKKLIEKRDQMKQVSLNIPRDPN